VVVEVEDNKVVFKLELVVDLEVVVTVMEVVVLEQVVQETLLQ
jgi:hypothetical protein